MIAARLAHDYVNGLVDLERGEVSREIFVNEEIYRREQEEIFSRAWLLVGHECQVPEPDDFVLSRMGEESVILTRDRQDELHVLLNTCRHRGMKVCRYDKGNTRVFTCPYHAWSYSTDGDLVSVTGELIGVPGYKRFYGGALDKQEWGLVQARMVNYKGMIFATWDQDAPEFEEYLGRVQGVPGFGVRSSVMVLPVVRCCWPGCKSGGRTATGSSRRRISAATPRTGSVTSRWTRSASD